MGGGKEEGDGTSEKKKKKKEQGAIESGGQRFQRRKGRNRRVAWLTVVKSTRLFTGKNSFRLQCK